MGEAKRGVFVTDPGRVGVDIPEKLCRAFKFFPGLLDEFLRSVPVAHPPTSSALRAGGEGRQFIKLMLRPVVKGMVVALSAADLGAEQDPHRVVDVGQRHPRITELEANGRVFPEEPVGGKHLVDPGVIRLVGANRILHVVEVRFENQLSLGTVHEAEDVGPVVVEMTDVVRALEEVVNKGFAVALGRLQEQLGFSQAGDPAGEIEKHAAEKLLIFERC